MNEYIDNHPYLTLARNINTLNSELTDECKHNSKLIKLINKTIGTSYIDDTGINHLRKFATYAIYIRKVFSEMIEAGATDQELLEIWSEGF